MSDPTLRTAPFDPSLLDLDGFVRELKDLRREIDASLGAEDLAHLRKMERAGRVLTGIGLLTAGFFPNPVSAVCLAAGRSTRWMIMHHVAHRGYDNVPGVPPERTSRVFARGRRRFLDWADWMVPEAWIYEHNVLHHAYTGEARDPDLVERNLEDVIAKNLPRPVNYAIFAFYALTWKITYYAPNTLRAWVHRQSRPETRTEKGDVGTDNPNDLPTPWGILLRRSYLPYGLLHFGVLPAMYLPFGPWASFSALANSVFAEGLTNLHTFCVIGPNHAGDDLFRFDDRPGSRAEAYVRQIIGSVNYETGSDLVDFCQLWLNYQIEHHVFPDLPMLQYQRIQPRFKALCAKYGIPYVQESVFRRVKKMADIFVGKATMKRPPKAPWRRREEPLAAE